MTPILCECGCGNLAPIAKTTDKRCGHVKGQPIRFISGHNSRWSNNPNWNGGRRICNGYVQVMVNGIYIAEHILLAERALGRKLPPGAQVHHVNEIQNDNKPGNLVLCEDQAYHRLLHRRARALRATGCALANKCVRCKQWAMPGDETIKQTGRQFVHPACASSYGKQRRAHVNP